MDENVTMLTVLQELREFRKETNERFDLMDKRITKLEEKVDKLDVRVCRLEEKVDKLDVRVCRLEEKVDKLDVRVCRLEEKVDKLDERVCRLEEKVDKLDARVSNLEEGRKTDRREILDVLDTMQKSITKQFVELKDYIDMKVERFNVTNAANDVEHAQFRQLLKAYGIKIDMQDCRVKYLEKWRKDFGESDFVAAF